MKLPTIISASFLLLCISCGHEYSGPAPVPENYAELHEKWKADRLESLTNPTGWMRLAGMYWLNEGENSFGSGPDQDIRFPEGTIPEHAGTFVLEQNTVIMKTAAGVSITHEAEPVEEMVIYDGENSPHLQHEDLEWLVIQRGDLTGIRLYNKENEKVDRFTGFDSYPLSAEWVFCAKFIPATESTTIPIVNILGQSEEVASPGRLEFQAEGKTYSLAALESATGRMFIILGDETNQTETYQAGRYMYIDYPEEGGDYTVIDFNKAYNPPCAYSLFTTCQLPPSQNRLDLAITAGEKRPDGWSGI